MTVHESPHSVSVFTSLLRAHRLMSPALLFRMLVLLTASANIGLWLFSPASLSARIEATTGQAEFQAAFAVLIAIGWLDVLINDLLPEGVVAHALLRHRHMIYAGIGAAYLVKAFVGSSVLLGPSGGSGAAVLLLFFVGKAFFCAWYVFTEVAGYHHAQR